MSISPVTYTEPSAPPPFVPGPVPMTPFNLWFAEISSALQNVVPAVNLLAGVYNEWTAATTGWGALVERLFVDNEIKLGTSTIEFFNSTEELSLKITLAGDATYVRTSSVATFVRDVAGEEVFAVATDIVSPGPTNPTDNIHIGMSDGSNRYLNFNFASDDIYLTNRVGDGSVVIEGVELLNGTIMSGQSMRFRYRTAVAPTADFVATEDFDVITMNPSDGNRTCLLPDSAAGVCYWVQNVSNWNAVHLRNNDSSSIATLVPGETALVCSKGTGAGYVRLK